MMKPESLSILVVAGLIAAWKILTMSNVPWWGCAIAVAAYALLVVIDQMWKKQNS